MSFKFLVKNISYKRCAKYLFDYDIDEGIKVKSNGNNEIYDT